MVGVIDAQPAAVLDNHRVGHGWVDQIFAGVRRPGDAKEQLTEGRHPEAGAARATEETLKPVRTEGHSVGGTGSWRRSCRTEPVTWSDLVTGISTSA